MKQQPKFIGLGLVCVLSTWAILSPILTYLLENGTGFVGYDYAYFIPRLLSMQLLFKNDPFQIPEYTAAVCGGFPLYADPQLPMFSMAHLFSLVTDVWNAIKWSGLCLLLVGGLGQFILSQLIYKYSNWPSAISAVLFMTNGFFWSRYLSGAVPYQSFMILPILYFTLLRPNNRTLLSGLQVALLISWFVYSGAYLNVLFFIFGLPFMLFFSELRTGINLKTVVTRLAIGILLSTFITFSKLVASWSFLRHFPREKSFDQLSNLFEVVAVVVGQLFFGGPYQPIVAANWEYNSAISPIVLLFLYIAFRNNNYLDAIFQNRRKIIASFAVLTWFLLLLCLIGGLWPANLLKNLPLFSSLRMNIRFTAALIIPLIVICSHALEIYQKKIARLNFVILTFVGMTALVPITTVINSYYLIPIGDLFKILNQASSSSFSNLQVNKLYIPESVPADAKEIGFCFSDNLLLCRSEVDNANEHVFIDPINERQDLVALSKMETNLICTVSYYEKRFSRTYPSVLKSGNLEANNGFYNLINPACLVYPSENNCLPGDAIAANDWENFSALIKFNKTNWEKSDLQRLSNHLSFWSLIGSITMVLYYFAVDLRKYWNTK